jgi:hypothetical protein
VTYRGERHLCKADGVTAGMAGGRAGAVIRRADGKISIEAAHAFHGYRGNA